MPLMPHGNKQQSINKLHNGIEVYRVAEYMKRQPTRDVQGYLILSRERTSFSSARMARRAIM